MVSGGQFSAGMTPLRFLVDRSLSHRAECTNRTAVRAHRCAGYFRTWGLIHEGHKLIREAGHGATDANAAHVGAAAYSGHPAAFGHVAVHDRAPTSQLHDALGGAVHFGEVTLLVVTGSIAALVDR